MSGTLTAKGFRGVCAFKDLRKGRKAVSPQIAIRFEEDTFEKIRRLAEKKDVSFACVVRELVAEAL